MISEDENVGKPPVVVQPRQFEQVAQVYDVLMHDVPYGTWIQYLRELLEARNARPRNVLDLACGTGNVTERLSVEGYTVVGVDIAEQMVVEARRKAVEKSLPIQYAVQDAADLNLPGRKFDLCVSLFDSLNYVTDPARLRQAIERVWAHLSRNGLFIFDMNSEYALKNRFFDQSNRAAEAPLRYDWVSEYYPGTRLCCIRMQFWYRQEDGGETEFSEEHWQFAYREDEVVQMLEDAGFGEISAYQAYTMRPTHRSTDRIFYIARKV